jgi:nickel/cobalt exporter
MDALAHVAPATVGARPAQPHQHDDGDRHSHRDAHQLAHADEIRRRFTSANVTPGQIVMLGFSGGLIPCSAAIAVLALCLQINRLWLGIALVACFSIGLAVTLVAAGIVGAVGMRHNSRHWSRRWSGLGDLARRAPYVSGIVMIGVGLYVGWEGWMNVSIAL